MFAWLKSWLGMGEAVRRPAPASRREPGATSAPAPASKPAPASEDLAVAIAVALSVPEDPKARRFGVRRPLVGRNGSVGGFELQLPASVQSRLASQPESPASIAHHAALLTASQAVTASGRSALVRLPAAVLAKDVVAAAARTGLMLLVDDLAKVLPDVASSLRARGVMLGFGDRPPAASPPVDFVMLDARAGGLDTLALSAQRWREAFPRIVLVGHGFAHLDDIEKGLRAGLSLAGGALSHSGAPVPRRDLGSAAHRICELLNHLAMDRETSVIADAVRSDVALTYRLLRYANSPAMGLRRVVDTVDDAVTLLGRAELYRWLSVQLMAAAQTRQASKALEEAALARGRLLELVARAYGDEQPGAHFTLGMLSLIEQLLQVPMAQALEPLRLSEPARDALLHRRGPWAPRLALLDALDREGADRVEALATPLVGADQWADLVDEAWRWASQLREGTPGR